MSLNKIQSDIDRLPKIDIFELSRNFILNGYSVLTAYNGLASAATSLENAKIKYESDLNNSVLKQDYEEKLLQYQAQQKVTAATSIEFVNSIASDKDLMQLGISGSRFVANVNLFNSKMTQAIEAQIDVSLIFAILADFSLIISNSIDVADTALNQVIASSKKVPRPYLLAAIAFDGMGDSLTLLANNLVDIDGNSKVVIYRTDKQGNDVEVDHSEWLIPLANGIYYSDILDNLQNQLVLGLERAVNDLLIEYLPEELIDVLEITNTEGERIKGTILGDKLIGTNFSDYLQGKEGEDELHGGLGNDFLHGGNDDDFLYGGEDNDLLMGGQGSDELYGGANDDILIVSNVDGNLNTVDELDTVSNKAYGGSGSDTIYGGNGDDELFAGDTLNDENDEGTTNTIYGLGGQDKIYGGYGDDNLYGGQNMDIIYGGHGNDFITLGDGTRDDSKQELEQKAIRDLERNFAYGGAGNDIIYGSNGNDVITTGEGDKITNFDLENDTSDNDTLNRGYGFKGDDILVGASGKDILYGGEDNDKIYGGADDDELYGGLGKDEIYGGAGDDFITLSDGQKGDLKDELEKKAQKDVQKNEAVGGAGNDTIYGSYGDDVIYTGSKNSNKTLFGLANGDDIGTNNTAYGYDGNDHLIGEDGDDTLYGGNDVDILEGNKGDDTLWGDDGNDELYGGMGHDVLVGGAGDDLLAAGAGGDVLMGGAGYDTYRYTVGENAKSKGVSWVDHIYDIDGKGEIRMNFEYQPLGFSTPIVLDSYKLEIGKVVNSNTWLSTDGQYYISRYKKTKLILDYEGSDETFKSLYNPLENDDREYHLIIQSANHFEHQYHVWFWKNGDLGLTLPDEPAPKKNIPNPPIETPKPQVVDPLSFDLNKDGKISTLSKNSGVYFDLDNSNFAEKTAWVAPEDGLLVLDRNGNGKIDGGAELFGTETFLADGTLAGNGYIALKEFDQNTDGVISEADQIYHQLRIWQDTNSNGISELQELKTLTELNIKSINLNYETNSYTDTNNVEHRENSFFTYSDNTVGVTNTLWFDSDRQDSLPVIIHHGSEIPVDEDILLLPELAGSGNVYSLHQAMQLDRTGKLKELVKEFVAQFQDNEARLELVEEIILTWTGVSDIDVDSLGSGFNAQHIRAVEKLIGNQPADSISRALLLGTEQVYQQNFKYVYTRLMQQSHSSVIFDKIEFTEQSNGTWKADFSNLNQYIINTFTNLSISENNLLFLKEIYSVIEGIDPYDSKIANIFKNSIDSELKNNLSTENYNLIKNYMDSTHQFFGTIENDNLSLDKQNSNAPVILLAGDDTVIGSAAADRIYGNEGNDQISGGANADTIYGGEGDDIINGDNGNDELYGDLGNDLIMGGDGNDNIYGGSGNDSLNGNLGNDYLDGGNGNDTYTFGLNFGHDVISNYDNNIGRLDIIQFSDGLLQKDFTYRRLDNKLIIKTLDEKSSLTINGYFDKDALGDYRVDLVKFSDQSNLNIETIKNLVQIPTSEADNLYAYSVDSIINGEGGNDRIFGGSGNDTLLGDSGNDIIYGNIGSNTIYGGIGNDSIYGGIGNDIIYGGDGNDVINVQNSSQSAVYGGDGNDVINVQNSSQSAVYGGDDNDVINVKNSSQSTIYGGDGADSLVVDNSVNIVLDGGNGDDNLIGAHSSHTLYGGEGYDTYRASNNTKIIDSDYTGKIFLNADRMFFKWSETEGNITKWLVTKPDERDAKIVSTTNYSENSGETIYQYTKFSQRLADIEYNAKNNTLSVVRDGYYFFNIDNIFGLNEINLLKSHMDVVFEGDVSYRAASDLHYKKYITTQLKFSDFIDQGNVISKYDDSDNLIHGITDIGEDIIYAGLGDDNIYSGLGGSIIYGEDGDDNIVAHDSKYKDEIYGGSGNDIIYNYDIKIPNNNELNYNFQTKDMIYGGSGNDIIHVRYQLAHVYGGEGSDIIHAYDIGIDMDGGEGIDTYIGGLGDDTFIYDGTDIIIEEHANGGYDTVITEFDFDLRNTYIESVNLKGITNSNVYGNQFDNAIYGNEGDNILEGGDGDDHLEGGDGNDYLNGGEGADYLNGGDGSDYYVITEIDTIITDDFGNNVLIKGDQFFENGFSGIDTLELWGDLKVIQFDENDQPYYTGSHWRLDRNIENVILKGEAKTLFGNDSDNVITLNEKNNYIDAGFGSDTIIYQKGGGQDTLIFKDSFLAQDKLIINGYTLDQIIVKQSGNDLQISFSNVSTDRITLRNYFLSNEQDPNQYFYDENEVEQPYYISYKPALIELTDGSVLTPEWIDNKANYLSGTSQNDSLYGTERSEFIYGGAGNDILSGGKGVDVLDGGAGDDKYYWYLADGKDVIDQTGGGKDVLWIMDYGVTRDRISFKQEGNDLVITVDNNAEQSVRVKDHFLGSEKAIETVQANNQVGISASEIAGIIKAQSYNGLYDIVKEGTASADTIHGTSGNDLIQGLDGNDKIWAGDGNDQLEGGAGDDTLDGQAGNDRIYGGVGNDTLTGGKGVDILDGGAGNDKYYWYLADGKDIIDQTGGGTDVLYIMDTGVTASRIQFTKEGNDLLVSVDNNAEQSVRVKDHFLGGEKAIASVQANGQVGITAAQIAQKVLGETIPTQPSTNTITGTANADTLYGTAKDDVIYGLSGDDQIWAQAGNDRIEGGAGNDYLAGQDGDDLLFGGIGSDTLAGGKGIDILDGGAGDDKYYWYLADGKDIIDQTGGGNDVLWIMDTGVTANRIQFSKEGNDLIVIVDSNVEQSIRVKDHFLGGEKAISSVQANGQVPITAEQIAKKFATTAPAEPNNPTPPSSSTPNVNIADYSNVRTGAANSETLNGSAGRDYIQTLAGDDQVWSFAGNDYIDGGDGSDYLDAGEGEDIIVGGAGADTLVGGVGNDQLYGGLGNDKYYYYLGHGNDNIYVGGGLDTLWLMDNGITEDRIKFTKDGNDLIVTLDNNTSQNVRVKDHFLGGEHALNSVQPNGGYSITAAQIQSKIDAQAYAGYDNVIKGTSASETLYGTAKNDVIQLLDGDDKAWAQAGNDHIDGGAGNDYLDGGAGDDLIFGGLGNDTLLGGLGLDILDGGAGDDNYYYYLKDGTDVIDQTGGGFDTLWLMDTGITQSRLSFGQDGQDLYIIVDKNPSQVIKVLDHFVGGDKAIDQVVPNGGVCYQCLNDKPIS